MLLAIDIGNTNITFGVFRGKKLVKSWRSETNNPPFPPLVKGGMGGFVGKVQGVIISSVVPEIDRTVQKVVQRLFKVKPVFVNYKNAGVKIGYPRPKEVGADRLVDAVAAWRKYRSASIIVDFGTATTFDYIDKQGRYFGGPIAPGVHLANEALYQAASKLPRAKVIAIKKMIPTSTVQAMQAGLYQGYIGMIEHILKLMKKEVGGKPKVIATGGLAGLVAKGTDAFDKVEPFLTLEGLRIIYAKLLNNFTITGWTTLPPRI